MKRLKRVADIRKVNVAKAMYIYRLLGNGKLTRYLDGDNYVCVDLDELSNRTITARRGRPPKEIKNV